MKIKRIAIMLGDPTGIGPEIVCKSLEKLPMNELLEYTIIGDQKILEQAKKIVKTSFSIQLIEDFHHITSNRLTFFDYRPMDSEKIQIGQQSRIGGLSVIKTLQRILPLVQQDLIHGIVFGPFNKQGLHEAELGFHSELEYLEDYFQVKDIPGEINIVVGVWAVRITSHVPLKKVSDLLTSHKIVNGIRFLTARLKEAGIEQPKLGIAGLNPHNGEDGLFGDEEKTIIAPAVAQAQQEGYNVVGPYPADTLFLRLKKEKFDGIVGMYHDQLQIGLKLLGFDSGVTLLGGLPVPITTGAHGTALDIAGKGIANEQALFQAIHIATKMVLKTISNSTT